MKKFAPILLAVLAFVGCTSKTPPSADGVSITDVPADRPELKREYVTQLTSDVSMKITVRTTDYEYSNYVDVDGELDQTDHKWVFFDPANPADRILDRDLLPLVQAKCDQILALDQQFRNSHPNSFIDKSGATWVRQ